MTQTLEIGHARTIPRAIPPLLTAAHLSLHYGARRAVDDVSFSIEPGAILCLLGASGSGKSSVLRMLAGLERPTGGTITLNGRVISDRHRFVEPEKRQVGMVFQDFALFPHLTVRDNVAFGIRRAPRAEIASIVHDLLTDVGLADRAASFPHTLSGGERQRVALARALATRPAVLLMDEPFSSLDVQLREQIREQTMALLRRRGTTAVLVTHDPDEALRVADRLAVLARGRLEQFGTPAEIYRRPCSPQMARAFGATNMLAGTIENGALRTPLGVFDAPAGAAAGPATVCVRPQHVALGAAGAGVRAVVTAITCLGDSHEVHMHVDGVRLTARVPEPVGVAVGDASHVLVDPSHLFVFPQPGREPSAASL